MEPYDDPNNTLSTIAAKPDEEKGISKDKPVDDPNGEEQPKMRNSMQHAAIHMMGIKHDCTVKDPKTEELKKEEEEKKKQD